MPEPDSLAAGEVLSAGNWRRLVDKKAKTPKKPKQSKAKPAAK
ncbi:MAG TPA: hypothetical protein VET90_06885 [Candidatus Binatus sp.]|nr:hypothetical protein [Candidatus Binatus sp.]